MWLLPALAVLLAPGHAEPRSEIEEKLAGCRAARSQAATHLSRIRANPGKFKNAAATISYLKITIGDARKCIAEMEAKLSARPLPAPPTSRDSASGSAERRRLRASIEGRVHGNGAAKASVDEARGIVRGMLKDIDTDVLRRLNAAKAQVELIPRGTKLTELPNFRAYRGVPVGDGRKFDDLNGVANIPLAGGGMTTAVAETQLGLDKTSAYPRGFLVTHEFAHVIHRHGLDAAGQKQVEWLHAAALKRRTKTGLGPYADRNAREHFAQAVSAFRGVGYRGEKPGDLRAADPKMFEFIRDIFSERKTGGAP